MGGAKLGTGRIDFKLEWVELELGRVALDLELEWVGLNFELEWVGLEFGRVG